MNSVGLFDTCVLFPMSVRDLSLELAYQSFFQIRWSTKIEGELKRNLKTTYKINATNSIKIMRKAFPDYKAESTAATLKLVKKSSTDLKDHHILASAIDGGCSHLVTYNLADFDKSFAKKNGVLIIHPDEFLFNHMNKDHGRTKFCIDNIVKRKKNPPTTQVDFAAAISKNNLPSSGALIHNL